MLPKKIYIKKNLTLLYLKLWVVKLKFESIKKKTENKLTSKRGREFSKHLAVIFLNI